MSDGTARTREEWQEWIWACDGSDDEMADEILAAIQSAASEAREKALKEAANAMCDFCKCGYKLIVEKGAGGGEFYAHLDLTKPHPKSLIWCPADPILALLTPLPATPADKGETECEHYWVGRSTASIPPQIIETKCALCVKPKPPTEAR